jgi:DNA protecting protein DprA
MVAKTRGYVPPPLESVHITTLNELLHADIPAAAGEEQFRLFESNDRALRLYCAGDRALVRTRSVAIVGTREPSQTGAARARRLARELAERGLVIVSGLARGVDTEALVSAMNAGGRVVAVIGTPLDTAYPAENTRLQEQIYREHLLLSPFPQGERVFQRNFPIRNRLMAAMTDATAIVEADDSSGTLHQATECVRLGRWLFLAESIVKNSRLTWPARFLDKPRVRVLRATEEILGVIDR